MADSPAKSPRASFVVPWYGKDIPGGAEAEARRTAQNLAEDGVAVSVLTTCLAGLGSDWDTDALPAGENMEDGIRVVRFPTAKRDGARFGALNGRVMANERLSDEEERAFFANMVHSPALLKYIEAHPEEGPFFFIPYLFTTSVWGPLIHPAKSVLIPCLHDEGYARMEAVRQAFEACRAVAFHVPAERDLAAGLYDLSKTKPLVLGEGVDSEWTADPERFRQKFNLPAPFILYAGRKDAGKNVPLLSQYFVRYVKERQGANGLKLIMIGNLPAPVPPGGEASIIDLGFVSRQEKYDAYAAASVLVQPSLMESFSLVIMEAWLAETPVMVHTGCAVTKEHVEASGGGLHFNDYPHFAECLDLLLGKEDLARAMAQAGRAYVLDNYSWPTITRRFKELIARIDSEPAPGGAKKRTPAQRPRRPPARPCTRCWPTSPMATPSATTYWPSRRPCAPRASPRRYSRPMWTRALGAGLCRWKSTRPWPVRTMCSSSISPSAIPWPRKCCVCPGARCCASTTSPRPIIWRKPSPRRRPGQRWAASS